MAAPPPGASLRRLSRYIERIMLGLEPPGALYPPLLAAQAAYSAGVLIKNGMYDAGALKPFSASCPVVSVGGLTLGGSGKTPLAIHIARLLMKKRKVGILSRGYGQQASENILVVSDGTRLCAPPPYSSDEAYMAARILPGVPVVTAPRRPLGAVALVEMFGVEAIVLDDGFQHRALARQVDIVLVDEHVLDPARRNVIPLGYLREPVEALRRADAVVVMIRSGGENDIPPDYRDRLSHLAGKDIPVYTAKGAIAGFTNLDGAPVSFPPGPALAFCGIANPAAFAASLISAGVTLAGRAPFPDHHQYSAEDLRSIEREAGAAGATALVTTEKDAARLAGVWNRDTLADRLYVARWELTLDASLEDILVI